MYRDLAVHRETSTYRQIQHSEYSIWRAEMSNTKPCTLKSAENAENLEKQGTLRSAMYRKVQHLARCNTATKHSN